MHFSTKLFIAAIIIFSTSVWYNQAKAFEVSNNPEYFVDFNIASFHDQDQWYDDKGQAHDFNEDNMGIGLRKPLTEHIDVSVGFYDNSFHKTSVYTGLEWHTKRTRLVSLGIAAALVSGYTDTPTPTILMFLPVVQLGPPQIGVRVGYMPLGKAKFSTMQFYLGF